MSSLQATLAPYTLFITLAMVTFLVLFIVYCVMYYDSEAKIRAPLPEWTVTATAAATLQLTAATTLNEVLSTNAAATVTFPTAAAIVAGVAAVKKPKNGMTFRFIVVNRGAGTVTLAVNTGVTVDQLTVLTTVYAVYAVTLTEVAGGSEAVAVTRLSTGAC